MFLLNKNNNLRIRLTREAQQNRSGDNLFTPLEVEAGEFVLNTALLSFTREQTVGKPKC
jgi:hypothetical protein